MTLDQASAASCTDHSTSYWATYPEVGFRLALYVYYTTVPQSHYPHRLHTVRCGVCEDANLDARLYPMTSV